MLEQIEKELCIPIIQIRITSLEYNKFEFDEKTNFSIINYGVSIGIGINIPISKYTLIILPEYKLGLKTSFL